MALYWGADALALWAATAAFGVQMRAQSAIIVLATGMLASRRTAPFGGAGLLGLALVPSLWYGAAAPFAVATLGVAAYQFFTLWLPFPARCSCSPLLRRFARAKRRRSSERPRRRSRARADDRTEPRASQRA